MSVSLKISQFKSSAFPLTFSKAWYIGTVPMGTGEFLRIHSRVSCMFLPVDRSIMVSAPHRHAQTAFSTSSSIEELTAELPMLALILTRKFLPIIIGSLSGWLILFGIKIGRAHV